MDFLSYIVDMMPSSEINVDTSTDDSWSFLMMPDPIAGGTSDIATIYDDTNWFTKNRTWSAVLFFIKLYFLL